MKIKKILQEKIILLSQITLVNLIYRLNLKSRLYFYLKKIRNSKPISYLD